MKWHGRWKTSILKLQECAKFSSAYLDLLNLKYIQSGTAACEKSSLTHQK